MKELTDEERNVILEILIERARGSTLDTALEDTGISRPTYYRWAQVLGDGFADLEIKAGRAARAGRQRVLADFGDQHPLTSANVRTSAAEIIDAGLPMLRTIVSGKSYMIKNAAGKNKEVFGYPRDIVGAMKVLHAITRDGLLGEVETRDQKPPPPKLPFTLPAELNLRQLTAMAADGTTVTVTRGEVLEAELVDEDKPDIVETIASTSQQDQEDHSSED